MDVLNQGKSSRGNALEENEGKKKRLALDQSLFWSLPKDFERSSCQRNNLAFSFLCLLVVGFDVLVRNALDELHNIVGLGNELNKTCITRLQELQ